MKNIFAYQYISPAILLLLLLNLGLLGWIWLSPPGHPRMNQPPADFLENELQFSTEQKVQYRLLREDHHRQTKAIRDSIRLMKNAFFGQLNKPLNELDIEKTTDMMAQKMALLDKITFQHFYETRQLCTPAQQQRFDEVIVEMLHQLASDGEGPKGPPPPR